MEREEKITMVSRIMILCILVLLSLSSIVAFFNAELGQKLLFFSFISGGISFIVNVYLAFKILDE